MTDYKPGAVATATVEGVEGVRVFRAHDVWAIADFDAIRKNGHSAFTSRVTDIRPLVVLDLADLPRYLGDWQETISVLRDIHSETAIAIADQIEAQTKPSRIVEPGQWGVVADKDGYFFTNTGLQWTLLADGGIFRWDEIEEPRLVREGLSA